ncbi:MAG TPA: DapH/DapD/GlmU-related protein [Myxococcota bacterium]|nr:DapH/DapD/GlmU-related protein [Myxococcota bacterium]
MQRFERFAKRYRGRLLHLAVEEHIGWLLRGLPGPLGMWLRYAFYRSLFERLASFAYFYPGVHLTHSYGIRAGRGLAVNTGALLDGRGGIRLGDDVLVGPYAVIASSEHAHAQLDVPMAEVDHELAPVEIGSDVWIGAHAVITAGIRIGDHAVVAAGAVVTAEVGAYQIVAGVPARAIGDRRQLASQRGVA